jgi:phospholipid-binding lipoprotein MlaA
MKFNRLLLILCTLIFTAGCASTSEPTNKDPWEGFNRSIYSFNTTVDDVILKPVAEGYDAVFPQPIKTGVSNFFSNLGELPTSANQLLQGKFTNGLSDLSRFVINSTLGLAGFFDVATELGLEEHDEDFGQTLAVWGVDSGPYLMLPLLGPSTVRDAFSRPVDNQFTVTNDMNHVPTRNSVHFMRLVDLRYRLLAIDGQLEDALDEYIFVRDAYLMRQNYLIHDGNPPLEEDNYEEDDCILDDEVDCEFEEID